jgi:response regulator NasT
VRQPPLHASRFFAPQRLCNVRATTPERIAMQKRRSFATLAPSRAGEREPSSAAAQHPGSENPDMPKSRAAYPEALRWRLRKCATARVPLVAGAVDRVVALSCQVARRLLDRPDMPETSLRILVVDANAMRASILEDGLREAGYRNVSVLRCMDNLLRRIVEADPEVIFIDLQNPNRDVLEQMFQVSRCVHRPIAMFVDQSDSLSIEAAVEAGVGAYVVDGLRKERIRSILDMAVSRFNAFSRLREELDRTKQALEERKVVDRAKGILMKAKGLDEAAAYELLRKAAMNENRRMSEVAQSVVTASRLLR